MTDDEIPSFCARCLKEITYDDQPGGDDPNEWLCPFCGKPLDFIDSKERQERIEDQSREWERARKDGLFK